jgi:hypothetical protein
MFYQDRKRGLRTDSANILITLQPEGSTQVALGA